ncbi:MAG: OmpA family protein [Bdellovibrionales bacterium]|nr:OmpA family protein [Bdellovibrionales bacterium]
MKLVQRVICLMGVLLIAACSGAGSNSTVDALNKAEAVGSPFTKTLAAEYRDYANAKQSQFDHADALHFARKGLASASGVVVMPETLDDWNLSDKNIVDLTAARAELVDALENGGRELASDKAGVAQASFDCWVEQQEESWTADIPCKTRFHDALKALQDVVGTKPVVADAFPAPVTEQPKGEAVPVEQAMFIVFFDWDKSDITSGANDVLDAVAQEIRSRKDINAVVIVGHTDTSGGAAYNQKLSLRRANAIKSGLVARGVDAGKLRAEGRGKSDLLVQTADGVREPANRRAQVTLE